MSLHARGLERGACTACCSRARTACFLLTAQVRMQYTGFPRCVHGRTSLAVYGCSTEGVLPTKTNGYDDIK
eukprot:1478363-Pleurochrysis_carterae.AAC.1